MNHDVGFAIAIITIAFSVLVNEVRRSRPVSAPPFTDRSNVTVVEPCPFYDWKLDDEVAA